MHITRRPKFREVISILFPQTKVPRGILLSLSRQWRGTRMAGKLYFDPKNPAGLDHETAACCSEKNDGAVTERLARSTGCLNFR